MIKENHSIVCVKRLVHMVLYVRQHLVGKDFSAHLGSKLESPSSELGLRSPKRKRIMLDVVSSSEFSAPFNLLEG